MSSTLIRLSSSLYLLVLLYALSSCAYTTTNTLDESHPTPTLLINIPITNAAESNNLITPTTKSTLTPNIVNTPTIQISETPKVTQPQIVYNINLQRVSQSQISTVSDSSFANESPSISGDGHWVAFLSNIDDLPGSCQPACYQVYLYDIVNNSIQVISSNENGILGNNNSGVLREYGGYISISRNAEYIVFHTFATNLLSSNDHTQGLILYQRENNQLQVLYTFDDLVNNEGVRSSWISLPTISSDGNSVVFVSPLNKLVENDENNLYDIFIYNLSDKSTSIASINNNGEIGNNNSGFLSAPKLSADGRFVVFTSRADNLVPNDVNGKQDVFLYDSIQNSIELISVASDGRLSNEDSTDFDISGDGRFVVFSTQADNLVEGDTNHASDIYIRDRTNSTTNRITSALNGLQFNGSSISPSISEDGKWVVFVSNATNISAKIQEKVQNIYLYNMERNNVALISISSTGDPGNNPSVSPDISADGRYIVFQTLADNLVPEDSDNIWDIYLAEIVKTE